MKSCLPSKFDVLLKIKALREEKESREEIAAWAVAIIEDDSVRVTDEITWEILKNLGGADLLSSEQYLYVDEDFAEWEKKLN